MPLPRTRTIVTETTPAQLHFDVVCRPCRKIVHCEPGVLAWDGPAGFTTQRYWRGLCPGCGTLYVVPGVIQSLPWTPTEAAQRDENGRMIGSLRDDPIVHAAVQKGPR